jgi:hypothetical protein
MTEFDLPRLRAAAFGIQTIAHFGRDQHLRRARLPVPAAMLQG